MTAISAIFFPFSVSREKARKEQTRIMTAATLGQQQSIQRKVKSEAGRCRRKRRTGVDRDDLANKKDEVQINPRVL